MRFWFRAEWCNACLASFSPMHRVKATVSSEQPYKYRKPRSGYNRGTIRDDVRYPAALNNVRRHRFCHGRGRGFESRRPRHSF
jgi:hypothetical protein